MNWTHHPVTPDNHRSANTTGENAAQQHYQRNILENNMHPMVSPMKQDMLDESEEDPTDRYHQSDNFDGMNPIISPIKQEMMDEYYEDDLNQFHHQSDNFDGNHILSPMKQAMVDDDNCDEVDDSYQYFCNVADDFDLFDGDLLRAIEVDEVFSNAAV